MEHSERKLDGRIYPAEIRRIFAGQPHTIFQIVWGPEHSEGSHEIASRVAALAVAMTQGITS